MAWLPEFGQVIYQLAQLKAVAGSASLDAARAAILAGDPANLLEAFPAGIRIDDPRAGRIEDARGLGAYREASVAWLSERNAQARLIAPSAIRHVASRAWPL